MWKMAGAGWPGGAGRKSRKEAGDRAPAPLDRGENGNFGGVYLQITTVYRARVTLLVGQKSGGD